MRKFLKRLFRPWKTIRDLEWHITQLNWSLKHEYFYKNSLEVSDLYVVIDGRQYPVYRPFVFIRASKTMQIKEIYLSDKNGTFIEAVKLNGPESSMVLDDTLYLNFQLSKTP